MVTIRRSVNDYHLRVVSHSGDPEPRCIERRVDVFLEDLYKVPGRPTTQPPLAFSECTFYGHQTVLIGFKLSPSGAHRFTLDSALSDFCERIFKPDAFSIARTLSSNSVLGLSAISETFRRMWNNSLYRQILNEREEFMRRIEGAFTDEYLPDWALASTFATFIGATFLGSPNERDSSSGMITSDSIFRCITIAGSILLKLSTLANPDLQQERWDKSHKEFKQDMKKVMQTITRLTDRSHFTTKRRDPDARPVDSRNDNRTDEHLYTALWKHLHGAMEAAARALIANRELLIAYVKLHKKAHKSMIANGVINGTYLATIITSAFSVTTTTTVVPLSQWDLAEVVGWLLLGETPLVQTTTSLLSPQLAAVSLGGAAYFGWSRYQDKKKKDLFAKKVDYHRKLKAFVVQAWDIAHLTQTLLRLVHCVGADLEFVNCEARSEWRNFIRKFNEARGRATPSVQLEPSHIMVYLNERRRDFEKWHRELEAHEAQIV